MRTTFIPLDYDYFDYEGKSYVKIYGRSEKSKRLCLIDEVDPYFWVILKKGISEKRVKEIEEKIIKLEVEKSGRKTNVLRTEIHDKKFLEKDVRAIKVFITNSKEAKDIADLIDFDEVEKKREYDIPFITRYIIQSGLNPLEWYEIEAEVLDNNDLGGVAQNINVDFCLKIQAIEKINEIKSKLKEYNPKVLAFDIETSDFTPDKGEVLMISLVGENFKKVLTCKEKSAKDFVHHYNNEEELLEAFVEEVNKFEPDIITGYFSDGFDLPFIKERAKINKVKLSLGVDGSLPVFSRGVIPTGKIKGIVHIDLLRFIRNAYSQYLQSETLSLNEVAKELLGEKKVDFNVFEALKKEKIDWHKFYEYNLQDSVITHKLFEKLWPDLLAFTKITNEPLFDTSRNTMARNFEDLVIHNANKFNEIIEKKPHDKEIAQRRREPRYEGAFVFQPTPGLYENIAFFDFSSMYGSVIVSYNLSRGTEIEKKEKDYHIADLEREKAYFSKKQGMIPKLLNEIIDKRREYKEEYKKNPNSITYARSNAYKLIANAAYGYQGFFGARYYSLKSAASTAYFARVHIKHAIEIFKENGFNVVYSDTDSVAITLGEKQEKEALQVLKKINKTLPGIMALDYEGLFKRGIWVTKRTGEFGAKKKYALIDKENKIKIRGFETVRRDWCQLARVTQSKILEMILNEGNEKKALIYFKDIINKIKTRKIELKELIIKTQLKKPIKEYKSEGPHVTIAKKMKELGLPTDIGMIMEYYISEDSNKTKSGKSKSLIRERARLPNENGQYNIEYYLNNQIIPAVENIFEVFSVNVKEIVEKKRQRKLFDF